MQSDIITAKEKLYDLPEQQLEAWYDLACQSGLSKPMAFCLGSIGVDGFPKSRVVLHKGFSDSCLSFYTNYNSQKSQEMEKNPNVSATFYWDEPMDIQVRVEGKVERLSSAESDEYFNSRPRGSKIGAWASPQSELISTRSILDDKVAEMEKKFEGVEEVPRPDFWGGYKIVPVKYDFMLMRTDRLHDRYEFRLENSKWVRNRVAP